MADLGLSVGPSAPRRMHTRSVSLAELGVRRLRNGKTHSSLDLSALAEEEADNSSESSSDEVQIEIPAYSTRPTGQRASGEARKFKSLPRRQARKASGGAEDEGQAVKVLRNGKVVQPDLEISMDSIDLSEFDDSDEKQASEGGMSALSLLLYSLTKCIDGSMDISLVEEKPTSSEEEALTIDIDLSHETLKSLLRLKRDELIALCRRHGLEEDQLKKDLAQSLLDWVSS